MVATCGDGVQCTDASCTTGANGGPEACDDSNTADDDACLSSSSSEATSCVVASCGDGFTCSDASCTTGANGGPEACDDANTFDDDACLSSSTSEATSCVVAACGDGFRCTDASCTTGANGGPEACDDSNTADNDSCLSSSSSEETSCVVASCGDGFQCTDAGCTTGPNGGPEECDDSNTSDADMCRSSSTSEETSCVVGFCGDGFFDPTTEECDDGNTIDGDCCDSVCDFEEAGSSCADDDLCNGDETCDGAGTCDDGAPLVCDDGLFCNGAESCDAMAGCQAGTPPDCSTGTVCSLPDCNPQCNAGQCDEANDECIAVPANEGATCDDDSLCSVEATCVSGECVVTTETILSPSCRWIIIGGHPGESVEVFTGINARQFGNDICGDTGDIGGKSFSEGRVVVTASSGAGINFRDTVEVEGDIVTGGADLTSGDFTTVPGTELNSVPGGQIIEKNDEFGNPTGTFIDTTGSHPLVGVCDADQDLLVSSETELNGLATTRDLGNRFKVPQRDTQTIVLDPGLNVIDIGTFLVRTQATLIIQGAPDDVVIFRTDDTIRFSVGSSIQLAGGIPPEHVLFYNKGTECFVGEQADGQGSWFCPNTSELHISREAIWLGTLLGSNDQIFMGHEAKLTWAPFFGR